MSNTPQSLTKNLEFPNSMDFSFLKKEAIENAQLLSGDIWTDYNEHDPGVTILEQFCYTITELGYKANFDIEKLIFAKSGEPFSTQQSGLYEAEDIFPGNPFTDNDYRRLIIDHCYPDVKNAWVIRKEQNDLGINIKGLYSVFLQIENQEEAKQVIQKVKSLLNANRNLCEDFDDIIVLKPASVAVSAEVSISTDQIGESVLGNIWFNLMQSLMPPIRFNSIEELMEKGTPVEDIFNGPALVHGVISPEVLHQTRLDNIKTIFKSNLIREINGVDGVLSVTDFTVRVGGKEVKTEYFSIADGFFPELDTENSNIQINISDIPYEPDLNTTSYIFQSLKNKTTQILGKVEGLRQGAKLNSDLSMEDIKYYYSLQNTFPRLYGVGPYGLPNKVTPQRKGQANQLKGYLLFFDQIMANYLAQLVKIRDLFSLDDEIDKTFFTQTPDTVPYLDQLLADEEGDLQQTLEQLVGQFDRAQIRRIRFLDHMLSRFGEEFLSESLRAIDRQAGVYDEEEYLKKSIRSRISFLKKLVEITRKRSKGFDYTEDFNEEENVPGIKKKLSLYFNIENYAHRQLSGLAKDNNVKLNKQKKGKSSQSGKIKSGTFNFVSRDPNIRAVILLHGLNRNNYFIEDDGGDFVVIFKNPKTSEESIVFQGKSAEECEEAIGKLIQYLKQTNIQSEGFHVLEHLLLRPVESGKVQITLSNEGMRLLTSKQQYDDASKGIKDFTKLILQYGVDDANFSVKGTKDNYRIELKDEKDKVVGILEGLRVKKTAEKMIDEIIEFIRDNKSAASIKANLTADDVLKEGGKIKNDPYSFTVSFIMPNWTSRFQNRKIQRLFEALTKINVPAHLVVNFFWVDLDDMRAFEDVYQMWLTEKGNENPDLSRLDDLSFTLIKHTQEFEEKYSND